MYSLMVAEGYKVHRVCKLASRVITRPKVEVQSVSVESHLATNESCPYNQTNLNLQCTHVQFDNCSASHCQSSDVSASGVSLCASHCHVATSIAMHFSGHSMKYGPKMSR